MTITFHAKHKSGFTVHVLEPFTFPGGEAHIKGFDTLKVEDYEYFVADIRGHDPQDLFHLAMWANGLDSLGERVYGSGNYPTKYVILPYLPAARADRGVPFGAEVYAQFLNSLFIDRFIILDPHSPVMPALLHNTEQIGGECVTEYPFERIIRREIARKGDHPYVGVIAPDKGAVDRARRAAAVLKVPVYCAGKTRDFETGKLTGFHMEDELPDEGVFLVSDDILDGGGTFSGLAEAIKASNPDVDLDLWVTHCVASRGFEHLKPWFGLIHTTDSYFHPYEGTPNFVQVHSITPYLHAEVALVHQRLTTLAATE